MSSEVEASPGAASRAPATPLFWISCSLLFAVALGLRVAHILALQRAPFFDLEQGDARSYSSWARAIAEGDWLGSAVFYQAPFYPYFLGGLYALAGDDLFVVRCVQALLGAMSCVLLADAGRRFFSPRSGLIAGMGMALYAPALFFDGLIQKAALGSFLLCLGLWLLSRIGEAARPRAWLGLGLVLGALVLTRENALALVAIVVIWCALQYRHDPARLRHMGALALGLLLMLGTVAIRNYAVGGEFHLTTSQLGPNFYIGNNADSRGVYMPLRRGRGDPLAEQRDARAIAEAETDRALSPGEVSAFWVGKTTDDIREDPGRWVGLVVHKFGLVWNSVEIGDTEFLEQHAEWSPLLRTSARFAHFGWLLPLAAIGVFASWGDRRRIWLLYLLVAGYAVSIVAFYVMARYRYPLVPLLMLFAGVGVANGARAFREASLPGRIGITLATLVIAVYCNRPVDAALSPRWVGDYNVGSALLAKGEKEAAIESLRRALGNDADAALVRTQLGVALHTSARNVEALAELQAAIAADEDFLDARLAIARVLVALGREPEALTQLRKAGQIAPNSPRPLNNAAWLLATSTRIDERTAKRALRMAKRANELSGQGDLYVLDTLAAAHAANGEFEEAAAIAEGVGNAAMAAGNDELAAEIVPRLAAYRSGKRFIAAPPSGSE